MVTVVAVMDNRVTRGLFQQKDLSSATSKLSSAPGEHAHAWEAMINNFRSCTAAKKPHPLETACAKLPARVGNEA